MTITTRRAAGWARACAATLVCMASVALFFRYQIMSGFARVFGDMIDGRIEITILEHWYNSLRGLEPWRDPIYFYPTTGALGFNDGYFLYGLVYAGWRALGVDPFLASDLLNGVMRIVAFGGFLLFAREPCRLPFGWAVLGAALFTLSNAAFAQAGHAQLFTVALAPPLGWLLWAAAVAWRTGAPGRAAALGCAAAVLFDAWLMTAFYTAWFTAFFTFTMGVVALVLATPWRRAVWQPCLRLPWWPVVLVVVVFAVGMVPFLLTYLPSLRSMGVHPVAEALALAPRPYDLINTGDENLVWSGVNYWQEHHVWFEPYRSGEFATGLPLALLFFCVFGAFSAWLRPPAPGVLLWRIMAAAMLVSVALSVRLDDHVLWYYVYSYVPGAGAIRVVSRYMVFLSIPATLLAVYGLARCSHRLPVLVTILVIGLLVAEQLNLHHQDKIVRAGELHFLATIPAPPAACKQFAITAPRPPDETIVTYDLQAFVRNVDAMLIAETLHLPTINGHASFLPRDFVLGPMDERQLAGRVRMSAAAHGFSESLCGLDLARHVWVVPPIPAPSLPLDTPVALRAPDGNASAYLLQGWSGAEATGRWTEGHEAEIGFVAADPTRPLEFALQGQPFVAAGPPSPIAVFANGHAVAKWTPVPGPQTLRATIPAAVIGTDGNVTIRMVFAAPHAPSEIKPPAGTPRSLDTRLLGFWAESFLVTPAPAP